MKRYVKAVIGILASICMIVNVPVNVYADGEVTDDTTKNIVTLGADLTDDEKNLILSYFGVTRDQVKVIEVTNEQEHVYLDGIATPQEIGSKTYSCCYIEPTESGGIHIKTVNLDWATCNMIRNALITSGINNCNIIAASPRHVSGTGSMAGIFAAYDEIAGSNLDTEKVSLASEELVTTLDVANEIGQDNASELVENIKEQVIAGEVEATEGDILDAINKYIDEHNIKLTEERKLKIAQIILKIAGHEYDIEEIRKSYNDIKEDLTNIKEDVETTKSIISKITDFFKTLWQKINGTYEEVSTSEEYKEAREKLGILLETNDSLLSGDTKITNTDDLDSIESTEDNSTETESTSDKTEETETKEKKSFIEFIKSLFNGEAQKEVLEEQGIVYEDTPEPAIETTPEPVEQSQNLDITEEIEDNSSILDKVTFDMQDATVQENNEAKENSNNNSFDSLTE